MGALTVAFQLVALLVTAAVMAAIIRRLLAGVGWVRCFLVSVIVFSASTPAITWVGQMVQVFTPDGHLAVDASAAVLIAALAFLWVFALSIGALVVLEVIVPTGAVWTPVEAVQQTRAGLRRTRRYLALAWIVATSGLSRQLRHGPDSAAFGKALVTVLNRSGVTFIKLGQILSTRPEIVSGPLADALESLQTKAAPAPATDIRRVIREEWACEIEDVLASFDEEPLAAASIAQVHSGRLRDGTPIVIKVQRPGAREQVAVDGDILLRFTEMAERRFDWGRAMGIAALGRGLVASLHEELDYRREAQNTLAVTHALSGHPGIETPTVYPDLVRERVLVMTRLAGGPASVEAARLDVSARQTLAADLLAATFESILVHGVFHADLHPGNILLLDDDRLGLLDFGAVGVIDAETRQLLATLLLALVTDDNVSATTALTMAFDVDPRVDRRALQRDLGRVMTLLAQTRQESAATFAGVFTVLRDHGIAVPGDVAAAFRTLASLDGTIRALDPSSGLFAAAEKTLPAIASELVSSDRVDRFVETSALTSAVITRRLPARVEHVSNLLARGELAIHSRAFSEASDRAWLGSMLDDAVSAVFAVVAIALGCAFFLAPGGTAITPVLSAYDLVAAVLGFVGLVLTLRLVVRLFTRGSSPRTQRR